ncbi:MAG TPA: urease accessory protein [Bacteroidota bacterium]|nr:urease accessory protein [Bacteroidota bacterium]
MDQSGIPLVALGFLLGVKHSLDVDHLAAVSTLLTASPNRFRAAIVGMYWGMGHSLSLLVLGGAIIWLDLRFPTEISLALEALVGLMLIFLGGRVFYRLARGAVLHVHAHGHGQRVHIHPHIHGAGQVHDCGETLRHHHRAPAAEKSWRMSFLVGIIHGLAGSAGLTLMLLPSIPTRAMGVVYLCVFGAGSLCGMGLTTFLLSFPLQVLGLSASPGAGGSTGARSRTGRIVTFLAGSVSLGVGAVLLWETGYSLLFS